MHAKVRLQLNLLVLTNEKSKSRCWLTPSLAALATHEIFLLGRIRFLVVECTGKCGLDHHSGTDGNDLMVAHEEHGQLQREA